MQLKRDEPASDLTRAARIEQIVDECLARRLAGKDFSDEQVLTEHPSLLPELADGLRTLALVHAAVERAGHSAGTGDDPMDADLEVPERALPGYRLLGEVHRGGQGVVYRALQESTGRQVAIKVMREGPFGGPSERARFQREVRILGSLKHPNIVAIHDSGRAAGHSYFVMDHVAGQPLDRWISGFGLPIQNARPKADLVLPLFAKICEAVDAAHLRGIIHRDLKPGNILIDEHGQPHILDFGLAKIASELDPHGASITSSGQFVGSLPWASPEQVSGVDGGIDLRTDVYSLGLILYHALTGRWPYSVVGSVREVTDQILTAAPTRPSVVCQGIGHEVETIVLKCLDKDRERRYHSAGDLARDIRRLLAGEPIEAKRESAIYVLRKYVIRHRIALTVLIAFVALLMTATIVSSTLYLRARDRLWDSYLAQARAGRWSGRPGRRFDSLTALRNAAAMWPSIELRNEAIACMALVDVRPQYTLKPPDKGRVFAIDGVNDCYALSGVESDGSVSIRRLSDGTEVRRLGGYPGSTVIGKFSHDGRYLAAKRELAMDRDVRLLVWDISTGERKLDQPDCVVRSAFAFTSDRQRIVAGRSDGTIHVFDFGSNTCIDRFELGISLNALALSPDGGRVAVCEPDSRVVVFDVASHMESRRFMTPSSGLAVDWSSDGHLIAVGCADRKIYVWDLRREDSPQVLSGHEAEVGHVYFSPGGRLLASVGWDAASRLWDLQTSRELLVSRERSGYEFSRGGTRQRFAGTHFGLAEVAEGREYRRLVAPVPTQSSWIDISSDGLLLAEAVTDGVRLWELGPDRLLATLPIGQTNWLCFNRDRNELFTGGPTGIHVWPLTMADERGKRNIRLGPPSEPIPGLRPIKSAASVAGRTLAVTANDDRTLVFNLDGPPEPVVTGRHAGVSTIVVSPDERFVATTPWLNTDVMVWDCRTGTLVRRWTTESGATMCFSPDGKRFAFGTSRERTCWTTDTWQQLFRTTRFGKRGCLAFSCDGSLLADARSRGTIELIDGYGGHALADLEPADVSVPGLLFFTPDGGQLVHLTASSSICVWDLRRVRSQLAEMRLDWDAPPVRSSPARDAIEIAFDLGSLATDAP